jgi:hypothetical protein
VAIQQVRQMSRQNLLPVVLDASGRHEQRSGFFYDNLGVFVACKVVTEDLVIGVASEREPANVYEALGLHKLSIDRESPS